jgi:hypothetical protein
MRRSFLAAILATSLGGMPILVGCGDKTLHSTDKTTTSPNGEQTTTHQQTVQHPDGSVTKEQQTSHNPPAQ